MQRGGRRRQTQNFVLAFGQNPGGTTARLGVTVSAKVGNAVVRNHVKRRVREAFRALRSRIPITTEIVVIARPGAAPLSQRAITTELAGVFVVA